MSIECGECERDLRGEHDPSCSRYVQHDDNCSSIDDEESACDCGATVVKPRRAATVYLMQNESAGYLGNSPLFWPVSNSGYTADIDEAKHFTATEAKQLIDSTRGSHSWKRWNLKHVMKASMTVCDIQILRRLTDRTLKKVTR